MVFSAVYVTDFEHCGASETVSNPSGLNEVRLWLRV